MNSTIKGKGLLIFIAKFLCALAFIFPVWYFWLSDQYGYFLIEVLRLFCDANFDFTQSQADNTISIVHTISKKNMTVNVLSLSLNASTLMCLFIATPLTSAATTFAYIFYGSCILCGTHLFHIYLDYFSIGAHTIKIDIEHMFLTFLKVYYFKFLFDLRIFFEQMGRELFPFIIWISFCYKHVLRHSLGYYRPISIE